MIVMIIIIKIIIIILLLVEFIFHNILHMHAPATTLTSQRAATCES